MDDEYKDYVYNLEEYFKLTNNAEYCFGHSDHGSILSIEILNYQNRLKSVKHNLTEKDKLITLTNNGGI